MDSTRYIASRVRRGIETVLFVLGMIGVLVVASALVLGRNAGLYALVGGAVALLVGGQVPVAAALRLRGARPLPSWHLPRLHATTADLARRAGLSRPPTLHVSPTLHPEAYSVSGQGGSAIALSSGLLSMLDGDELEAVLAHEISHVRSGDTRLLVLAHAIRRLTSSLIVFAAVALLLSGLGFVRASLPLFPLILVAPALSFVAAMGLSRTRELDADLFAAALTGKPLALASALHKLDHHHRRVLGMLSLSLDDLVPAPLRSHPRTLDRVRRLVSLMPAGGVR